MHLTSNVSNESARPYKQLHFVLTALVIFGSAILIVDLVNACLSPLKMTCLSRPDIALSIQLVDYLS